jgi:hypothetical protein
MTTSRFLVHASLLAATIFLIDGTAHAQNRAVERTNFEIAVKSADSDTSGSTSNGTLGADLRGTVPLGGLFAVSLSGGYARTKVRTRDVLPREDTSIPSVRPSCSFDNTHGEVSLFARRPTLGKLAVSYGVGRLSADCDDESLFIPSNEDRLETDGYRIDAEVYLWDFTLGASRSTVNLDNGPELETTTAIASWYPIDSLRVSVSGSDLYDEDTYGLVLEHQPEFLGDAFGVQLGYSRTDTTPNTRTIHLGLTYHFGARVELKARDRQYR